ncbi:MAG: hypothetical protein IPN46_08435 [Saprospiraceae bacterium]|nr:hypothetical protein [Saprospiraceae bacterium]
MTLHSSYKGLLGLSSSPPPTAPSGPLISAAFVTPSPSQSPVLVAILAYTCQY